MSNDNDEAGKPGQPLTRLSSPVSELSGHATVIVVGSGYGGAITASRLARAGLARAGQGVWLLERGRELHPGEFPDSLQEAVLNGHLTQGDTSVGSRTGLFDLRTFDDMNVMVGCGLGGTSLINANVSLEAERAVFEQDCWPAELRDKSALNEGYARARAMLRPARFPERDLPLPKLAALEKGAKALAADFTIPPINVTFDKGPNAAGIQQEACTKCGDCVAGCNVGAKNTVLMNYLPDAVAHGAKVFTKASVHHISRDDNGRWRVHLQLLETGRELFDEDSLHKDMLEVTADVVVLSAGTLGSTEILLRSKEIGLSDRLGHNFSGNGDVLAFSYNGHQAIQGIGWGIHQDGRPSVGPCITGAISVTDGPLAAHMTIEEGSLPGGLSSVLPGVFAVDDAVDAVDTKPGLLDGISELGRQFVTALKGPYTGALNNTMTYLVMAHDGADGQLDLVNDHVRLVYPGVGDRPIFKQIRENLIAAATPLNGDFLQNPMGLRALGKNQVTVHPLGGCPMGDDATKGVVNHMGQVFDTSSGKSVHEGLYVADGSVIPTSLGVNPLLTISAIAERNVELLAQERGWTIDHDGATPPLPPRPTMIGIQFTERMAGSVAVGDDIPQDYTAASEAGGAMSFLPTIIIADLDAFLRNRHRTARMIGTVTVPYEISALPLVIRDGTFNLLTPNPDRVGMVDMKYSAILDGSDGRTYCLKGHKNIHDDRGFDTWSDTTTLYVDLYAGDDDTGNVIARGVVTLSAEDFATQLRGMRVTGTHDVDEIAAAKAKFAKFFAGELAHVYGGVARPARLIDTSKPPRIKRPLRAPTPVLHPFTTDDGVDLRLTRYQGGSKGPVLVTHGLGVSSTIFTIDTIETNLVEYLCANKYDVWLLDYRSSIDLPASRTQYTGDDIAKYDYPDAVEYVLSHTGHKTLQVVAHCFGSTTFMCAMLSGLHGVRAAVLSQIATHIDAPTITRVKSRLRVPHLLERIGIDTMTARAYDKERRREKIFDAALNFWPMGYERCDSATCHRITFLYALLHEHDQLNPLTHEDGLPEMFGVTATSALDHLATMVRAGFVVEADGSNTYMPWLQRLALPLTIVHGKRNVCYLPSSTEKTIAALREVNDPTLYSRHVIPYHGHLDCIYGKTAAHDVYPYILGGLAPTAEQD